MDKVEQRLRNPVGFARKGATIRAASLALTALAVALLGGTPANAQDRTAKAREAAAAAREAAREAQNELEEARRSLEEAATRVAEKAETVEELEAKAAVAEEAAEPRIEDAISAAERAERRAVHAERQAQKALARVKQLEGRFAYDRTGLYLGGSVFYAPESFDEDETISVKSSVGAMGRIGYRVHSRVALDMRFDYLEGFDVFNSAATGTIDGWSVTGNIRGIILPWRWQPWVGIGAGAIRTDFDAELRGGGRVSTRGTETDPLFRFGAGFDTYITTNFVLTVEAALNTVLDDRDYINYGQLGVGLDYRF